MTTNETTKRLNKMKNLDQKIEQKGQIIAIGLILLGLAQIITITGSLV